VIVFIVFMERSQRRLLIQYPKQPARQPHGRRRKLLPAAEDQHLGRHPADLRLVPAAAAGDGRHGLQAAANLPAWMQWLPTVVGQLQHGQPLFMLFYGGLIIFFCFFYTSVVFNPDDTAENLRKYGGFLPGIRPGKRTAEYLDYVLTRLTVIGAAYIAAVCLLPEFLISFMGAPESTRALGGTSILIVVSVTMDTVAQIQSHLLAHQYEGLIKKSKLRGGRK
jgi:preprotein translocase subunit SecY